MDMEQLNNTQHWKKFLQSPKRIAFIVLSILIVTSGLVLNEMFSTDEPVNLAQNINLPPEQPAEQTNDAPVAVIEETPTPPVWHAVKLDKNTSLTNLLKENQISADDIIAVEALPEVKTSSHDLQVGQTINILQDEQNKLYGLRYSFDMTKTLDVTRDDNQFIANIVTQPIVNKQIVAHGTITGSMMQSAAQAGIPRKIVLELANMFAWKVNFNKDLQLGDTFTVVYDAEYVGDQKIDTGDIVAAEINLEGATYRAIRFTDADGDVGYYTPLGQSLKSGFLRTPVHYVYVSSPFSLSRMQPILHIRRPHLGVDLAAPRGTPIEAAGDGTVTFVGRDAGYGNLIIIDHGHGITTRYGHIYHFVKGIYPGMHVKEGQVIAYVGSTGLATGPHLHYEFRINGVPYDPMKVKLPGGTPINSKYRKEFLAESHQLVAEIDAADNTALASKDSIQTLS
jgi:murein DD-endopeptidase MepM/ murein hydrolase activator NlpD